MRPRSVSMYIEKGSVAESNEDASDDNWLLEDKLKLIVKVKDLVPSKDNMPFDERIQNINWKTIEIGSYSPIEIKEKFWSILKDIRKYRILTEILKEAEKDLHSALHIKKPLHSFALFIHENKDEISTKNAEINGNYTQTAANIFKSLSGEEKKKYESKYQKAKQDYKEELSKYQVDKESTKNKESTKINKKSIKIQQYAPSPFSYFMEEVKHKDKAANYNSTRKKYCELKPKEKIKWILKFLGVTRGNMLSLEQYEKAVSHLKKEEMSLVDDYEKRPKKTTAYNIFIGKYLKSAANMNDGTDPFKAAAESWRNLAEPEKLKLNQHSAELKSQYDKDLEAFLQSLPEDRKNYEKNKKRKSATKNISTNKPAEEIIAVKDKKKRSRNLETNDKEKDEPTQKTRKLTNNTKSIKNNNMSSSEKNKNKSFVKELVKPPGSLYKYFALKEFKGPRENAKSAFKLLNKRQKEELSKGYEKTKKKYLKKFEEYLVSLSAEEIALFAKEINENTIDDNMSDVTDSD